MISAQHLTRRFGSFTAVEDISFELERGEVVGFLGPNGAGKTTTMRMLTGFLPASSGTITVAGHDVLRESLAAREQLGYLPEAVPLYREHRVEEMLLFQGRLHGLSRSDARRRGAEVLERVGMKDRLRHVIGRLSKGQRQRIGLAVALLPDPEVLILDEPTSGLDPLQRIEVRTLIRELASERTVLLSSHILPEVEAVCPRVIILQRGRIVADGTHAELIGELGSGAHVAVEAVVPDAAEATRLIASLPGVVEVLDRGKQGIHHGFEVRCEEDVSEDVGALAAQRGWALRRLEWHRPTLEQLFARIALELDPHDHAATNETLTASGASGASARAASQTPGDGGFVELPSLPNADPGAPAASSGGVAPTLNPFLAPPPEASEREEGAR